MIVCEPLPQTICLVKIRPGCASQKPCTPAPSRRALPRKCFENASPWKFVIPPFNHQEKQFLLSRIWTFIPMQAWALASQWESFPQVSFSNSSAYHHHRITVTIQFFKCYEILLHLPKLKLSILAQELTFWCHSVSQWEEAKMSQCVYPGCRLLSRAPPLKWASWER